MPLAQHLRADESLGLRRAKAIEDANELPLLSRRIAIEHLHRHTGKVASETLRDFLCAESDRLQHLPRADGTFRRDRLSKSAVVAHQQPFALVHGERHAAVAAAELVAAFAAQEV